MDAGYFDGFAAAAVDTGETRIHVRHGGRGPAVLLLHGFPQTHLMWHRVAPALARDFTVVAADLRGYGASGAPATADDTDQAAGRRIRCPVLALWSRTGAVGTWYDDPLAVWRGWADDVRGRALDGGHFLPEETPEAVTGELRAFFA